MKILVFCKVLLEEVSLRKHENMFSLRSAVMTSWFIFFFFNSVEGLTPDETEATIFMETHNIESSMVCNIAMEFTWNYQTNVTLHNRRKMLRVQEQAADFRRMKSEQAAKYPWRSFSNRNLKRMFFFASELGPASLSPNERREYGQLIFDMQTTYSEAKICPYDPNRPSDEYGGRYDTINEEDTSREEVEFGIVRPDSNDQCAAYLELEPDLTRIMRDSRDPRELLHVWKSWRSAAGRPIRRDYLRLVHLSNKAARLNGYSDTSEWWKREYEYENGNFEDEIEGLWEDLKPLYTELHAYVRRKLRQKYGEAYMNYYGTLPAHLLGNMWGQNWLNILDITSPYPERPRIDVSKAMQNRRYTPTRIYRAAEDFFVSLGFPGLPFTFWFDSLFENPINRKVVCEPSAWDFCNRRDYRVKHCVEITMKDLIAAHSEVAHIYYAIAYKDTPMIFRDGANPSFHEAVGEAVKMSASTPNHLKRLRLLDSEPIAYEDEINYLFEEALQKLAFLPFAIIVDKWRWKVFRGEVGPTELNDVWWQLRVIYQGVSPPEYRRWSEFDPGAKHHISAHIPYIRYFVSHILQYQIYEELCRVSGHSQHMHKCNFYGSREAGRKLRSMMRLGRSETWQAVLSNLTDGRNDRLDARPLLRYFKPLRMWLERQNRDEVVGWDTEEALFALTGALINVSSATFIGVMVLSVIMVLLLVICVCYLCNRKTKKKSKDLKS